MKQKSFGIVGKISSMLNYVTYYSYSVHCSKMSKKLFGKLQSKFINEIDCRFRLEVRANIIKRIEEC